MLAFRAARRLPRFLSAPHWRRTLSLSAQARHERLREVLPPLESFARRHIGPSQEDTQEMLKVCGVEVSEWWKEQRKLKMLHEYIIKLSIDL